MGEPSTFLAKVPFADAHADALMWNRDLTVVSEHGHVDFPRLAEANVKLQCFTLVTRGWPVVDGFPLFAAKHGFGRIALRGEWACANWQIDQLEDFCRRSEGRAAIATVGTQLDRNLLEGRLSCVLGVEGAHALEGRVDRVAELARRGVRFMSLTHLGNNSLGGTSMPLMGNRAMTPLGGEVLEAMAAAGMSVDLAHASRRLLGEILERSSAKGPRVFCSHAGAAALSARWRNLEDSVLRRVAELGGVVGVIFGTIYLGGRRMEDLARHLEHVLKVCGEDAVAFGSDFDGSVPLPRGMRDARDLPRVAELLLERGHPERVVEKVAGGNLIRFFRETLPG